MKTRPHDHSPSPAAAEGFFAGGRGAPAGEGDPFLEVRE
jgi:hypothetical protein